MSQSNAISSRINSSKPNGIGTKARSYRALAAECERQAQLAFEEPQFRAMQQKLARSYAALAEAEEWLAGMTPAQTHADCMERNEARAA